jgi:mannose-6-phosphate isomerase-like protein (cupin superfamily)
VRYRRAMAEPVNLAAAFASFDEAWSPRIAGGVNDFQVKVVKLRGEFVWHAHETEDELFLVVAGSMVMRLRDGDRTVEAGEFIIVPHGVEHCPFAPEEAHVVLFERAGTLNTGDAGGDRTVAEPRRLG